MPAILVTKRALVSDEPRERGWRVLGFYSNTTWGDWCDWVLEKIKRKQAKRRKR